MCIRDSYLNDYEPKDLVNVDSEYVAPTCDHPQLRKVAANALIKICLLYTSARWRNG